jgi:hypothetical protein
MQDNFLDKYPFLAIDPGGTGSYSEACGVRAAEFALPASTRRMLIS